LEPEPYRLYLDQMFGVQVANALRAAGFDVMRAWEAGQSRADDAQILRKTIKEKRVLVTLDGHFGDWVVLPLGRHPGVIRLKVNSTTSRNVLDLVMPLLQSHAAEEFVDHLIIVSKKRIKWIHTA
jgi:predicted nuclease of predicted toxin-antitoxin system